MNPKTRLQHALFITALLLTLSLAERPQAQSQSASTSTPQHEQVSTTAPLFDSLGNYHHPISSRNPQAQRYFNQGLILAYGFNHAEALRSFQQAAALDPNCAICYWGMAYVLGPNINAVMEDSAVPTAWDAIQKAIALSPHASEKERAYIAALAARYTPQPVSDRVALNLAYAKAMGDLSQRYPDDLDAATLYAEALMDTTPWDYWQADGTPKPEGAVIINTLESVLKRNPDHPGALHLYIHAVEAERPQLAAQAADRLRALNIQTGHLVHMPSHIYIRVGRYQDAIVANQQAAALDAHYAHQHHPKGIYRIAYMPHNYHFLWYAAVMSGQQEVALQAARQTADLVDRALIREPDYGTLQHYSIIPLYTAVRFGLWDRILAEPAPDTDLLYARGVWHFARGMALVANDRPKAAAQELAQLKAITVNPDLEKVTIWGINKTSDLLNVAIPVLAGELAARQGNWQEAIAQLKIGVEREDRLNYDEPSPWYAPVRQNLGATLLKAGLPAQAEQAYREDLAAHPENGWSLYGLMQSLEAQGKTQEARAVGERYQAAWQYSDVSLSQPRF
jgi:tetratricopeptide (TPR) repeat protein